VASTFLVVLDEITYPLIYGWLPLQDVLHTLRARPKDVHVCLTGRRCPPEIIELADTVTEMTLVKHAFKRACRRSAASRTDTPGGPPCIGTGFIPSPPMQGRACAAGAGRAGGAGGGPLAGRAALALAPGGVDGLGTQVVGERVAPIARQIHKIPQFWLGALAWRCSYLGRRVGQELGAG
jgi:hypothetical protein